MTSQSGVLASGGKSFRIDWPVLAVSLVGAAVLAHWAEPLKFTVTEQVASALEKRIPQGHLPTDQSIAGIIVLGGNGSRVTAALKLAEHYADVPIVLSGPGPSEIALAQAARLTNDRLIIDRRPKNTYENALYSRELVGREAGRHWIVVTSALHMPRAFASFSAFDLPVVPWPVADTPAAMRHKSPAVWHEVFGLLGYWAMGRTHTLYPVPPGQYAGPSSMTASG
ncbi:MAG: YdcF family protein [Hyphomicrobiaceae bacterium]